MTSVAVDAVTVGQRHRHVDKARVDALAESMAELGLQQPISIWIEQDGEEFDVHLVAGLHRLEAARKLGWADIEAIEVKLDETRRELWEIDENLMRSELTTEEKREHLKRRKELWEKAQAERVQSGHRVPVESKREDGRGHRSQGFAADTAEKTGMSKRQINRLLEDPKERKAYVDSRPAPPVVDDRGDPDMARVAEQLARKYTAGQLQEIIDYLSDVIKSRVDWR